MSKRTSNGSNGAASKISAAEEPCTFYLRLSSCVFHFPNDGSNLISTLTFSQRTDRMFTSRSEYRMTLRSDNADLRLTEKGRAAGAVGDARWARLGATRSEIERVTQALQGHVMSPQVSYIRPACRGASSLPTRAWKRPGVLAVLPFVRAEAACARAMRSRVGAIR